MWIDRSGIISWPYGIVGKYKMKYWHKTRNIALFFKKQIYYDKTLALDEAMSSTAVKPKEDKISAASTL